MSSLKRHLRDDAQWLGLTRRYLRFGTRSTAQVRAYLASRGAPARTIDRLVTQAVQRGWLDDPLCGRLTAATLAERGLSDAAIQARLVAQGLDGRLVARTVKALDAEPARVRRIADRMLARRGADPARIARRLAQRGFEPDLITQTLSDLLPDSHSLTD